MIKYKVGSTDSKNLVEANARTSDVLLGSDVNKLIFHNNNKATGLKVKWYSKCIGQ